MYVYIYIRKEYEIFSAFLKVINLCLILKYL